MIHCILVTQPQTAETHRSQVAGNRMTDGARHCPQRVQWFDFLNPNSYVQILIPKVNELVGETFGDGSECLDLTQPLIVPRMMEIWGGVGASKRGCPVLSVFLSLATG